MSKNCRYSTASVSSNTVAVLEDTVAVLEDTVAVLEDIVAVLEDTVAVLEDTVAVLEDTVAVHKAVLLAIPILLADNSIELDVNSSVLDSWVEEDVAVDVVTTLVGHPIQLTTYKW